MISKFISLPSEEHERKVVEQHKTMANSWNLFFDTRFFIGSCLSLGQVSVSAASGDSAGRI